MWEKHVSYVWSQEQVQSFLDIFHSQNTHIHSSWISVEFETTSKFARAVLPPCLDVPEKPTITISVALVRESFKGRILQGHALRDEEEVGMVAIKAMRKGREGIYSLSEIVSGDYAVASGREFWGNPKKRGNAQIYSDSRTIYAWTERLGARIIEIEAKLGKQIPATQGERLRYYTIKYDFKPDGSGFASDPLLVTLDNAWDVLEGRELTDVRVTLRSNNSDPVETLELGTIVHASFTHASGIYLVEGAEPLDGRDKYLPYVLGRIFDQATRVPKNDGARVHT